MHSSKRGLIKDMSKKKIIIRMSAFLALMIIIDQICNFALVQPGLSRIMFHELKQGQYNCIILGASHGSYGLDPEIVGAELKKNTMNMCMGGEYMIDAYYTLEYALDYNKIDEVVFDIDYQYLVNYNDVNILHNNVYNAYPASVHKVGYYVKRVLGEDYRGTMLRWTNYWQCYKYMGRTIRKKLSSEYKTYNPSVVNMNRYDSYMGEGFTFRNQHHKKDPASCLDWNESKVSEQEIGYIKKLVSLCKKKGIKIVFTTVSQDPATVAEKESGFTAADAYISKLAQELDVTYLNFNKIRFDEYDRDSDDFYDREGHMYGESAEKFSQLYGKYVNMALMGDETYKSAFYANIGDMVKAYKGN